MFVVTKVFWWSSIVCWSILCWETARSSTTCSSKFCPTTAAEFTRVGSLGGGQLRIFFPLWDLQTWIDNLGETSPPSSLMPTSVESMSLEVVTRLFKFLRGCNFRIKTRPLNDPVLWFQTLVLPRKFFWADCIEDETSAAILKPDLNFFLNIWKVQYWVELTA